MTCLRDQRRARRTLPVCIAAVLASMLVSRPAGAILAPEDITKTPGAVLASIRSSSVSELIAAISELSAPDQTKFFDLLQQSLAIKPNGYKPSDIHTIEQILTYFKKTELLLEPLTLRQSECFSEQAPSLEQCFANYHGAAYAMWERTHKKACWEALENARSMERAFRDGLQDYYARNAGSDDSDLSACKKPQTPPRCRLAFCNESEGSGIQIRPAASLGLAVSIGKPTFGYKKDGQSISLEASAGVSVRAFTLDDRIDAHVVFGLTNGVAEDGETNRAGVLWGGGVGVWSGIIGFSVLGITNPSNAHTGFGLSFSVDVVAVKDQLADKI